MTAFRLFCSAVLVLAASAAMAQTAADKGYQIAKEADSRDSGYGDFTVSGKMILRDSAGRESTRMFDLKSLEGNDGDQTLLVFTWPGDIRDAALLTHSFSNRDDDQWLYLPALNRVKRISGSGRSGSFVGSEFSYEDMVNQGVDKFSYQFIDDEPCPGVAGLTCHVVDRTPKYSSGYSRERVVLDAKELRVISVSYYDRGGSLVKVLTTAGYRLYQGRFWRPDLIRMENKLTGKSSDLQWSGYKFGVGLVDGQFTVNALQNVR